MMGASAAEGTAVVLLGHRDQRTRVSDRRARRLPCAAGIEHSAHYAAASAADSRTAAAARVDFDDRRQRGGATAHNVGALCLRPAPAFHPPWARVSSKARSCRIVTVFIFFGSFRG
jgi:hypothetical protein